MLILDAIQFFPFLKHIANKYANKQASSLIRVPISCFFSILIVGIAILFWKYSLKFLENREFILGFLEDE